MDDLTAIVGSGPLLVLAPHPDDESLACGALLAACWQGGIAAHVLCLTDGASSHPGSREWPPARLAELRRTELKGAVRILGGDPDRDITFLGHPDAALHGVGTEALGTQIERVVDRLGTNVLIVPSRHDRHGDHVATADAADLAAQARPSLRMLSCPIWSRWAAGRKPAPQTLGTRRHTFDVAPHRETKTRAIAAHASQRGAVVRDDPDGFAMPPGFAEMFADGPEIFDARDGVAGARTVDDLRGLYATTDDPWDFRTSSYEAAKYAATVAALPRPRYAHALELGCGNGELALRIAPRCARYTGLDAVDVALAAARRALPRGRFIEGFLPCDLPDGFYDLIVLSEIVYFLDPPGIAALAAQIDARWPDADVIAVTWRGPSGNALEGDEACDLFIASTTRLHDPVPRSHPEFRIDRFASASSRGTS